MQGIEFTAREGANIRLARLGFLRNSLLISLVNREFGAGDGFDGDCVRRQSHRAKHSLPCWGPAKIPNKHGPSRANLCTATPRPRAKIRSLPAVFLRTSLDFADLVRNSRKRLILRCFLKSAKFPYFSKYHLEHREQPESNTRFLLIARQPIHVCRAFRRSGVKFRSRSTAAFRFSATNFGRSGRCASCPGRYFSGSDEHAHEASGHRSADVASRIVANHHNITRRKKWKNNLPRQV